MRRRPIALIALAMFGGCAMPQHSNTLIFGTNTKLGFDVSVDPTTTAPNVTLGYKRQEAAWVPLLANKSGPGSERGPADCPTATPDCVFMGTENSDRDAYSVLGTFGAEFSGGARTAAAGAPGASTQAAAGIAQYFATGHAARILAYRGGAQLVNTAAISPEAVAMLNAAMSAEDAGVKKIMGHVAPGGQLDRQRLAALVDSVGEPRLDPLKTATNAIQVETQLRRKYDGYVARLAEKIS